MAPTRRVDHTCARIVDQGISLDAEKGCVIAWAYLIKHGVSEAVAVRVLSTPALRRPYQEQEHRDVSRVQAADAQAGRCPRDRRPCKISS